MLSPPLPPRTFRRVCAPRRIGFLGWPALGLSTAALLFWMLPQPPARATEPINVDAAIVFAIDMSSSIHPSHADIQRLGHADALRSREVAAAIASGPTGCIAIAYVEWSVPGWLRTVLPWTILCGDDDRHAAAGEIAQRGDTGIERRGRGGTAISYALEASSLLLDQLPVIAHRKVIDVSANGTNNDGLEVSGARDRVLARGHVINAIVLEHAEPGVCDDLPGYFRDNVIGGPGAFVVSAADPDTYARALRRKLVLEISGDSEDAPAILIATAPAVDILPAIER